MNKTATTLLFGESGSLFFPWLPPGTLDYMHPGTLPWQVLRGLLEHYDRVIFLDWVDPQILFSPLFEAPHRAKSYVFYWNPVAHSLYPQPDYHAYTAALQRYHKVYSFQPEDCACYGLEFQSTMYAPPPPALCKPLAPVHDLVFAGRAKDRLPLLRQVYQQCMDQGLRTKFLISKNHYREYQDCAAPDEHLPGWTYADEYASYERYLRWLGESRAVLDVYQSGQSGYSLRVMEHLFFGKKLVTNNPSLRRAAFYHPGRIFLLGEDEGLGAWLHLPAPPIDETIKAYYTIEQWIQRFT